MYTRIKDKVLDRLVLELDVQSHIEELKERDMKVIKYFCEQFGCPIDYFFLQIRRRECTDARHLVCYFLRKNRRYTLYTIGKMIGVVPKDHTTVLHSIKTAKNLIDTIEHYRNVYSLALQETTIPFTSLKYRPCTN